eukprot:tig00021434_g21342.t3
MTGGKQAPGVSGSFPSFPESGRIDAAWLSDPGAAAAGEDPFLLVSTDPANPNYRDCFLGNGYIGQRLGPEGHAGFYDTRGECFVAGLWGRNALVSPPRYAARSTSRRSMTGGKQAPGVSGSFPSFPESGRIDAAWLSDPGAAAAARTLSFSSRRIRRTRTTATASLAMGARYIGQRLGPEGHAGFYDTRGECFVAGLWGRNALVSPPRWCGLVFEDGAGPYRVSSGRHDGYSQVVDMREGTAVTRSTWTYGGRTTDVETTVVLCRHRRQLAYVVTTITPQFEGEVRYRSRRG